MKLLKMAPEENLKINYSFAKTKFGQVIIASTEKGICYLGFVASETEALENLRSMFQKAELTKKQDLLQEKALSFFTNKNCYPEKISLHVKGTAFQLKVWKALLQIPEGEIASYGKIAKNIENQKACRAVGTAVASNPVAYLIPCHRVIRANGSIGEYHWGSERKADMLEWEKARVNN